MHYNINTGAIFLYNAGMDDNNDLVLPGADVFPVVKPEVLINADSWGDWERLRGRPFRRAALQDGRPVLVYDNGAVKAADNGGAWLASGPGQGFTGDTASKYRKMFQEQAEAAFLAGLADGAGVPGGVSPAAGSVKAWGLIGRAQYQIAVNADKGRASTEAARFIGRAAGFLVDKKESSNETGITVQISGGAAAALLAALASRGDK